MKKGILFMTIAVTLTLLTAPIVGCSVLAKITQSPQGDYTATMSNLFMSATQTLNFNGNILTSNDNLVGKQKVKFYYTNYRNLIIPVNATDADYIALIDLSTNKTSYVKFKYIAETDTVVFNGYNYNK